MEKELAATLLRVFIGESDKFHGQPLYRYLVEYLRKNHYSGVTVVRGIEGYGRASKIHTSDILDLSSDLPIVVEIVDTEERITQLKKAFDETQMIGSCLITEEKVKIIQYGKN